MYKIKVQIALEGEDAELYDLIKNKKQFLITAMKMFSQDDKLKMIFFNDVANETASQKKHAEVVKENSPKNHATAPVQTQTSSKKGW